MMHRSPDTSTADLAACLQRMHRGRCVARRLSMEMVEIPADYTAPLLDAVSLFEELGIGYALIGGLAAMHYGRSRFTEDVDFVAAADHEAKLAANGEAMRRLHFDPGSTWKLYHESGVEIDIWK